MRDPFAASGPLEVYGHGLLPPSHPQPPQQPPYQPSPFLAPASFQAQAFSAPVQPAAAPQPAPQAFSAPEQRAAAPQPAWQASSSLQPSPKALQPPQLAALDPFSASGPLHSEEHLASTWSGGFSIPVQQAQPSMELSEAQPAEEAASEESWGGFEDHAAHDLPAVPGQVQHFRVSVPLQLVAGVTPQGVCQYGACMQHGAALLYVVL